MCDTLVREASILQEWDILIKADALQTTGHILPRPQILDRKNRATPCDEKILRSLPIDTPVNLDFERWIVIYDPKKNFQFADNIFSTMADSCKRLNMLV